MPLILMNYFHCTSLIKINVKHNYDLYKIVPSTYLLTLFLITYVFNKTYMFSMFHHCFPYFFPINC